MISENDKGGTKRVNVVQKSQQKIIMNYMEKS